MHLFDIIDIGTSLSKRFARGILIALLLGFCFHPQGTINFLYAESVKARISIVNAMSRNFSGTECRVEQDGLFGDYEILCEPVPETGMGQ